MKISRRSFLGSTGAAGAGALAGGPAGALEQVSGRRPVPPAGAVRLDRSTVPVLRRCEVAVAGGSFAGVSAALAFARAGRKVVLLEPRTYLGRELTATLRPWVKSDGALPEVVQACAGGIDRSGELPLKMDTIKLANGEAEWDVIARTRKPDYMFMGHLHRPIAGTWRGIPFHIQRALTHQVAFDFETEGYIPGTHETPDYSQVTVEDGNLVVHQCSFLYDGPAFSLHDAKALLSQSPRELAEVTA